MENYREYCVVAIRRSKYGNGYKEIFRGRRKDCRDFVKNYCNYEVKNKKYFFRLKNDAWSYNVEIKEVKGDNSIYNTKGVFFNFYRDIENFNETMEEIQYYKSLNITRRNLENKFREYIKTDIGKLEEYTNMKINDKYSYEEILDIAMWRSELTDLCELDIYCKKWNKEI